MRLPHVQPLVGELWGQTIAPFYSSRTGMGSRLEIPWLARPLAPRVAGDGSSFDGPRTLFWTHTVLTLEDLLYEGRSVLAGWPRAGASAGRREELA